jgi:hypothetical protein
MTTTGNRVTGTSGGRTTKQAAASVGLLRRSGAATLIAAAGAACGLGLTNAAANVSPPDHVKTLHVASLTIVRDRATGTVSGFPNRRKVMINKAAYVADRSGVVHLAGARLDGLNRLDLSFLDTNGDVETGTSLLRHATTGIGLTSAQLRGAKPTRTKPQTMKLSIRPAMFSPPPKRPKTTG